MGRYGDAHVASHRHRPRVRSADGQVFGVLLLVFGAGWLLRETGAVSLSWEALLSAVLVVLGVGMVVTARSRTGPGVMIPGITLVLILASTSSIQMADLRSAGNRTIAPASFAELDNHYFHPFGDVVLDLRAIEFPEGTFDLDFDMFTGELDVILPDELAVDIDAELRAGELTIFDEYSKGGSLDKHYRDEEFETATIRLDLNLDTVGGAIRVHRASDVPLPLTPIAPVGPPRGFAPPNPPEAPRGAN